MVQMSPIYQKDPESKYRIMLRGGSRKSTVFYGAE